VTNLRDVKSRQIEQFLLSNSYPTKPP